MFGVLVCLFVWGTFYINNLSLTFHNKSSVKLFWNFEGFGGLCIPVKIGIIF